MVKKILPYYLLIALMLSCYSQLCFSNEANDTNTFIIVPEKNTVEMGKYLAVKLIYKGDQLPGKSHLQGWYKEFFVEHQSIDNENVGNGLFLQTEYLRLYPRLMGQQVLHAIALGGAIAMPVKITVTPAIRKAINVTPEWQGIPVNAIWQGETIKISIMQNLLYSSNQIVADELKLTAFVVQKIKSEVMIDSLNSLKKIKLSWLITAKQAGNFILEPPKIIQRGRGRWRFHLPYVSLKVKPLPDYIPPTVPIGKLSLKTGIEYYTSDSNKPYWFVELKNKGLLTEEVYGIRTQLAILGKTNIDNVQYIHQENNKQGFKVAVPEWTFYFNDRANISLQYFDIQEGQIKWLKSTLPATTYISNKWLYLLFILLVLMLIYIGGLILLHLRKRIQWHAFCKQIQVTNQADTLRKILLEHSHSLSLDEWFNKMMAFQNLSLKKDVYRKGKACLTKKIIQQLNELCFSDLAHKEIITQKASLKAIKRMLIELYVFKLWLSINIKTTEFRT